MQGYTQFFWIRSAVNGNVLDIPFANSNSGVSIITWTKNAPISDNQLWYFDGEFIVSRLNGFVLDIPDKDKGAPLRAKIITNPRSQVDKASQRWHVDFGGRILSRQNGLAMDAGTVSPGSEILLQSINASAVNGQIWMVEPYLLQPDTSIDMLQTLNPGTVFYIRSSLNGKVLDAFGAVPQDAQTSRGVERGLALLPESDPPKMSQLWKFEDGYIVNAVNDEILIKFANNDRLPAVISRRSTGRIWPHQQWTLTQDGYLVNHWHASPFFVLSAVETSTLLAYVYPKDSMAVLADLYDPGKALNQQWILDVLPSQTTRSSKRSAQATLMGMDVFSDNAAGLGAEIQKLEIKIEVADELFAGTTDQINIAFNGDMQRMTTLLDWPKAGETKTVPIDVVRTFGRKITIAELSWIALWQRPIPHPILSDAWKLKSLTMIVNDKFFYRGLSRINEWIDNPSPAPGSQPQWSRHISWAAWSTDDDKPVDLDLKTYSVTLIPYIFDILHWRTYDPSTIDGVGILIGRMNGKIVGELIKDRVCEELKPGEYTWVYVPAGDYVIYKFWDQGASRSDYVRHSQLGSGAAVICAGVLEIEATADFRGISTIIGMVNDASGHYKPDGGACLRFLAAKLNNIGIATDRVSWRWRD